MEDPLYQCCSWCNHDISEYPSHATTENNEALSFCDILCAKLYNDNVEKIEFDFDSFTKAYLNTQSKRIKKLYDRCKDMMFEEMPIYTTELHNRYDIKLNYENLFMK